MSFERGDPTVPNLMDYTRGLFDSAPGSGEPTVEIRFPDSTEHTATPVEQLLEQRSSYATLRNEFLNVSARLPLLNEEEVFNTWGISLGSLMAVVYRAGIEPVLCFNQTSPENGRQYLVINLEQLLVEVIEKGGDLPASLRRDRQSIHRVLAGPSKRFEVPLPQEGLVFNFISGASLPEFIGNTEFLVGFDGAGFVISDLDSEEGTYVQFNEQFPEARDPWEGEPFPSRRIRKDLFGPAARNNDNFFRRFLSKF